MLSVCLDSKQGFMIRLLFMGAMVAKQLLLDCRQLLGVQQVGNEPMSGVWAFSWRFQTGCQWWPRGPWPTAPAYTAWLPSSSSMRSSWLYLATRSLRLSEPVLI